MNIISYLDNDAINKPSTRGAQVYAISQYSQPLTKEQLVSRCLDGEYHIRVDPQQTPVQHPPRRVPVALRDHLKSTLDELEKQDIVAPVTEPTPWVNSLVVVPKKDNKLRLCLDPKTSTGQSNESTTPYLQ